MANNQPFFPNGWELKPLGEISDFEGGSQPPKKEFIYETKEGYIRFLQIRDFSSDKNITYIPISKKNRVCTDEDILIGRYGASVGKILTGKSGAYNVAIMKAIPKLDLIDRRFFYMYLISPHFQNPLVNEISQRAAQNGFSKDDIALLDVFLPPLPEQQRIVAKLDVLFAKIDKSIELHQKNMDEADVFMRSVLNEVFGELEEKYENKKINEVVKEGGKTISTLDYPDLIYFSLEDIEAHSGKILKYQTALEANVKGTAVRFDAECVLYSKLRPYLNKVAISKSDGCSTTELVVLRPNENLDKYYLAYFLRSPNIVNFLHNDSMGAKMPRTNMKTFRAMELPMPPLSIQQKVVDYLNSVSEKMEKIKSIQKEKMDSLKALKASILDKAFRGELL